MLDQPHHDPSERWVSNPTPDPGETVTVTVDVPGQAGVDRVLMRTMHDGEARWLEGRTEPSATGQRWAFDLTCHNPVVELPVLVRRRRRCPMAHRSRDARPRPARPSRLPAAHHRRRATLGAGDGLVPDLPRSLRDVGRPPRRAARLGAAQRLGRPRAAAPRTMRQMYGGDLDGIVQHLDHLVDLGVGGIYLTPIFPAHSNHRYDASSFDRVDPVLGGDAGLVRLREACDRAGLRLLNDLTLNHTGDRHEWFVAAQADAASEQAGYYYFTDHPDDYESWLGVPSLPKVNHASAPMRRRFYDGPDSVVGPLPATAVLARRLADRRRQHDRPLRHARPQRDGALARPAHQRRRRSRPLAGGRALVRRVARRDGRRVARRHELHRASPGRS